MGNYMPGSGTEGMDFEAKWCARCTKDANALDGDGCPILANAYAGIQPNEWRWWRSEPVCDAYDGEVMPYHPGFAVTDLFPSAPRRPTQGAQVRALVQHQGTQQ
jgi:hypothetical protein